MPVKNQRKYFYVDRLVRVSIYWFSINSHLGRSVCVSWRNLSSFVLTVTTSVRAYVHGWRCLQKAGTFQGQFLKTVHPRQSLAGFVFILLSLSSRVVFRETNRDFHYPAYPTYPDLSVFARYDRSFVFVLSSPHEHRSQSTSAISRKLNLLLDTKFLNNRRWSFSMDHEDHAFPGKCPRFRF